MTEVARNLDQGDAHDMARELTALARRLDGNADELSVLRERLGDLRRHAETVRS